MWNFIADVKFEPKKSWGFPEGTVPSSSLSKLMSKPYAHFRLFSFPCPPKVTVVQQASTAGQAAKVAFLHLHSLSMAATRKFPAVSSNLCFSNFQSESVNQSGTALTPTTHTSATFFPQGPCYL